MENKTRPKLFKPTKGQMDNAIGQVVKGLSADKVIVGYQGQRVRGKKQIMTYDLHHLRDWLLEHPLLSRHAIEKEAKMSRGTLEHFIKERRGLPEKYHKSLVSVLSNYGYIEFTAE